MNDGILISLQPIIVIGAARSGTKLMRDLIGASAFCDVVPHDVNYIWRYKNEGQPHDVLNAESCTTKVASQIRKRLSAAARQHSAGQSTPSFIVEKTVSNCLRVPFVDKVFPEAIYIHLLRDGRDVVESSVRMWREPVSRSHIFAKLRSFPISNLAYAMWYLKNITGAWFARDQGVRIWGVRYPGIEEDIKRLSVPEICAHQWRTCVEKSTKDLVHIPSSRVIEVRYESLICGEEEMQRICELLQLPDRDNVLSNFRREIRPQNMAKWCSAFDGQDWDAAMKILEPTLESLGYD